MNQPTKPKPVYIPADLHKRLKAMAADRESKLQYEVEQAIQKHLRCLEKRKAS